MTFEEFHKALIADERWHETMRMIHKYKPFDEVCQLVYGSAMSEGTLEGVDISEHRKHVHNKLAKTQVKIQNTIQTHQPEVKHEKVEVKVYATDDQREYWLNKLQEEIKGMTIKPITRLSKKQIADEGDWLPKKKALPTDPGYFYEHLKLLKECQRKTIIDRHPDWNEKQIEERLNELNKGYGDLERH